MGEYVANLLRERPDKPGLARVRLEPRFGALGTTPVSPPGAAPPPAAIGPPRPVPLPTPPAGNPFAALPFRSPGDRIKADDFNALARGLQVISDLYALSGALFGVAFAQAKLHLASQRFEVLRVMTVFGTEIDTPTDSTLDNRKVIQLVPVGLGERRVMVVVTEAVETRRFAPNLLGLNYRAALERHGAVLGEVTFPTTPTNAAPLVGRSLKDARQALTP